MIVAVVPAGYVIDPFPFASTASVAKAAFVLFCVIEPVAEPPLTTYAVGVDPSARLLRELVYAVAFPWTGVTGPSKSLTASIAVAAPTEPPIAGTAPTRSSEQVDAEPSLGLHTQSNAVEVGSRRPG